MENEQQVLIRQQGSLGLLCLNRPKALNSLTMEMVHLLEQGLTRFEQDDGIASVLIVGEGERGLCAGGDIKALYQSGKAGDGYADRFWAEQYRLDARIGRFSKPYIAFMDGITMGGGVGISAHGSHRIVTERTKLAMPETGIGFFPDVGGTWILSRSVGEIGSYIGLTGQTFSAADAIFAGFADSYMQSARLPELIEALARLSPAATTGDVDGVIAGLSQAPSASDLAKNRTEIDAAFGGVSVSDIIDNLVQTGDAFSLATAEILRAKSPTSLKLTFRLLQLARTSDSLEECIDREYVASKSILSGNDFYEGVRAAIIDKDRNPRWDPATLDAVDDAKIEFAIAAQHKSLF